MAPLWSSCQVYTFSLFYSHLNSFSPLVLSALLQGSSLRRTMEFSLLSLRCTGTEQDSMKLFIGSWPTYVYCSILETVEYKISLKFFHLLGYTQWTPKWHCLFMIFQNFSEVFIFLYSSWDLAHRWPWSLLSGIPVPLSFNYFPPILPFFPSRQKLVGDRNMRKEITILCISKTWGLWVLAFVNQR